MDSHLKNFGPRLRALVEERGTAAAAYQEIGVSRATLFNWFNRDDPPPGKKKLDLLASWLGEDAPWILDGVHNRVQSAAAEPLSKINVRTGEKSPLDSEMGGRARTSQNDRRSIKVIYPSDPHLPLSHSSPEPHDVIAYVHTLLDAADGDPKRVGRLMDELHEKFEATRVYWLNNPNA